MASRASSQGRRRASLAELAAVFPVQIIDPEVHRLIEEGPSRRRRFLDWGVFHVEPRFVAHWQKYQQALRQRNAALRARQPRAMVSAWDGDLIRYGELLTEARRRYVAQLEVQAKALGERSLEHGADLELSGRMGTPSDSLREALERSWTPDQEYGRDPGGTAARGARHSPGRIRRQGSNLTRPTKAVGGRLVDFPDQAVSRETRRCVPPCSSMIPRRSWTSERLEGLIQEVRASDPCSWW